MDARLQWRVLHGKAVGFVGTKVAHMLRVRSVRIIEVFVGFCVNQIGVRRIVLGQVIDLPVFVGRMSLHHAGGETRPSRRLLMR